MGGWLFQLFFLVIVEGLVIDFLLVRVPSDNIVVIPVEVSHLALFGTVEIFAHRFTSRTEATNTAIERNEREKKMISSVMKTSFVDICHTNTGWWLWRI